MTVRAKFTCTSVRKYNHWDKTKGFLYDYEFSPVTSGSEENQKFFAATPSGKVSLSTISSEQFEIGKDYYLDFIPVDQQ